MISFTPLKLLNLAQLALISKLLLNKNPTMEFSKETSSKMQPSKTRGSVMIFLGKHTIQLPPEMAAKSNQSNINKAERYFPNGKHVSSMSQYLNRSVNQSVQQTRQSTKSSVEPDFTKISRSTLTETNPSSTFYLPYGLTKHNKIQFFDFYQATTAAVNSTKTTDKSPQTLSNQQMLPLLGRLLRGKSPPHQSPDHHTTDSLIDGEPLIGKWINSVVQRQQQSVDTAEEDKQEIDDSSLEETQ